MSSRLFWILALNDFIHGSYLGTAVTCGCSYAKLIINNISNLSQDCRNPQISLRM